MLEAVRPPTQDRIKLPVDQPRPQVHAADLLERYPTLTDQQIALAWNHYRNSGAVADLARIPAFRTILQAGLADKTTTSVEDVDEVERAKKLRQLFAESTDMEDFLVRSHVELLGAIAASYRPAIYDQQLARGIVGLNQSVRSFNPEKGVPFRIYAGWGIRRNTVREFLADEHGINVMGRSIGDLAGIDILLNNMKQKNGSAPTREQARAYIEKCVRAPVAMIDAALSMFYEKEADKLQSSTKPRQVNESAAGNSRQEKLDPIYRFLKFPESEKRPLADFSRLDELLIANLYALTAEGTDYLHPTFKAAVASVFRHDLKKYLDTVERGERFARLQQYAENQIPNIILKMIDARQSEKIDCPQTRFLLSWLDGHPIYGKLPNEDKMKVLRRKVVIGQDSGAVVQERTDAHVKPITDAAPKEGETPTPLYQQIASTLVVERGATQIVIRSNGRETSIKNPAAEAGAVIEFLIGQGGRVLYQAVHEHFRKGDPLAPEVNLAGINRVLKVLGIKAVAESKDNYNNKVIVLSVLPDPDNKKIPSQPDGSSRPGALQDDGREHDIFPSTQFVNRDNGAAPTLAVDGVPGAQKRDNMQEPTAAGEAATVNAEVARYSDLTINQEGLLYDALRTRQEHGRRAFDMSLQALLEVLYPQEGLRREKRLDQDALKRRLSDDVDSALAVLAAAGDNPGNLPALGRFRRWIKNNPDFSDAPSDVIKQAALRNINLSEYLAQKEAQQQQDSV